MIMFPDVDGFEKWKDKVKDVEAIGCKIVLSDLLEKNATNEDRANKIDLADWLIRRLSAEVGTPDTITKVRAEMTESEKALQYMVEVNPALQQLIDMFNLELVA